MKIELSDEQVALIDRAVKSYKVECEQFAKHMRPDAPIMREAFLKEAADARSLRMHISEEARRESGMVA